MFKNLSNAKGLRPRREGGLGAQLMTEPFECRENSTVLPRGWITHCMVFLLPYGSPLKLLTRRSSYVSTSHPHLCSDCASSCVHGFARRCDLCQGPLIGSLFWSGAQRGNSDQGRPVLGNVASSSFLFYHWSLAVGFFMMPSMPNPNARMKATITSPSLLSV